MSIIVGSKIAPFRFLLQRCENFSRQAVFPSSQSVPTATKQNILVSLLVIVGLVTATLLLFLMIEKTVYNPMIPLVFLLSCFVVTRFFGGGPGTLSALFLLTFLSNAGYFGIFPVVFQSPRFTEVMALALGAILCGCWLRLAEHKFIQLEQERISIASALIDVEQRQRRFLREVLASVTEQRLVICDGMDDLPKPLPIADTAPPLRLTSSTICHVRARIHRAGSNAGLNSAVIDELIIAGSEAALNAVVHGVDGTAETYADSATGRVQIWVRDQGNGIDASLLHRATLERGFSSSGTLGQGFPMIVSTCDRVYLLTGKTGTTVVIEGQRH